MKTPIYHVVKLTKMILYIFFILWSYCYLLWSLQHV